MDEQSQLPSEDDWIIVPRWGEFQHYRNRNPRWIKVYSKLLQDPNYLGISMAAKGLLQMIWLAYSQQNGVLSVANLLVLTQKKLSYPQLISLKNAGFVDWSASKPLAQELEVEIETPSPLTDKDAHRLLVTEALDVAAEWGSKRSDLFDDALDELERKYETTLQTLERVQLWDVVLKRGREQRAEQRGNGNGDG